MRLKMIVCLVAVFAWGSLAAFADQPKSLTREVRLKDKIGRASCRERV